MHGKQLIFSIAGWFSGLLFFTLGILNLFLVHPVPGFFYMLFSLMYFPPLSALALEKFSLKLPWPVKLVLALMLLWATLAVGDLAEMYGL